MKYRLEDVGGGRKIVVDNTGFPLEKNHRVTRNLLPHEIELIAMSTRSCPAGSWLCARRIEEEGGDYSSLCECLHNDISGGSDPPDSILCGYQGGSRFIKVDVIRTDSCPTGKTSCRGCENMGTIIGNPVAKKSHSFVWCRALFDK